MEAVKVLLDGNVDLSTASDCSTEPLAVAATTCDLETFEKVLRAGGDKWTEAAYDEALCTAAYEGRTEILDRMLRLERKYSDNVWQAAFELAGQESNWVIVQKFLDCDRKFECDNMFNKIAKGSEQKDGMLEKLWVHTNGHISQATRDHSLYDATDNEKQSTVVLLLTKFGANPNATGTELGDGPSPSDYGNALTAAAFDGTIEIVRVLLEAGANPNAKEGWAIQIAAQQGHMDVVKLLLEHGADINMESVDNFQPRSFEPRTALQAACDCSRVDMVEFLLRKGANPNLGGGSFTSPLISAAFRAEPHILKLLLQCERINVDVSGGPDMSTPLYNAAFRLPTSCVQLLLDKGANINLPNTDGETALMGACLAGDDGCADFLIQRGADIMHVSKNEGTALRYASQGGHTACVNLLLTHINGILIRLKKAADEGEPLAKRLIEPGMPQPEGGLNEVVAMDGNIGAGLWTDRSLLAEEAQTMARELPEPGEDVHGYTNGEDSGGMFHGEIYGLEDEVTGGAQSHEGQDFDEDDDEEEHHADEK